MNSRYLHIRDANLSHAWLRAVRSLTTPVMREAVPFVLTVNHLAGRLPDESSEIRTAIDQALHNLGKPLVGTVASTIFPVTMWDETNQDCEASALALYERYGRIFPRISRYMANRQGTYFGRLIGCGSSRARNQIAHIVETYRRGNHRRSALQLIVYDLARDQTHQRRRGFPCLHQIAVTPYGRDRLALTGFYGTQHVFTRAYGNILGLAGLGVFIGRQLGRRLTKVTCVAGVGALGCRRIDATKLMDELPVVEK